MIELNEIINHFKNWWKLYLFISIIFGLIFLISFVLKIILIKRKRKIQINIYDSFGDRQQIYIDENESEFEHKNKKYLIDKKLIRKEFKKMNYIKFLNYYENNPTPFIISDEKKQNTMTSEILNEILTHKWIKEFLEIGENKENFSKIILYVLIVLFSIGFIGYILYNFIR